MMRRVRIVLAVGLALLAVAVVLAITRSPMVVSSVSVTPSRETVLATTREGASYCQPHELVPQDTSAIRLWLGAMVGPRLALVVSSAGHVVVSGERGSGWRGKAVTVPVHPPAQAVANATVCTSFKVKDEEVLLFGAPAPPTFAARDDGHPLPGRIVIEYLRRGHTSWAAMALSIARRMGLGRAYAGTWIALLVVALVSAVALSTVLLLLKELR